LQSPPALLGNPIKAFPWDRVLIHVIMAPVSEETYFRGVVYLAFRCKWGLYKGVVASAVFFAHLHSPYFVWNPLALPLALLLGLTLTVVYEQTGSLPSAIVAHSLYNLAQLVPL